MLFSMSKFPSITAFLSFPIQHIPWPIYVNSSEKVIWRFIFFSGHMTYIHKFFYIGHITTYLFSKPHDLYTQILPYRSYDTLSFSALHMTFLHKFFRIGHVTLHFSIASHDLYKLIPPYRSYLPSIFASSSPLLNLLSDFSSALFQLIPWCKCAITIAGTKTCIGIRTDINSCATSGTNAAYIRLKRSKSCKATLCAPMRASFSLHNTSAHR